MAKRGGGGNGGGSSSIKNKPNKGAEGPPTQAAEDLTDIYRQTTVARALAEALVQLGDTEQIPDQVVSGTMEAFDEAILSTTENVRNLGCRAKGEGEMEAFNNIDERWRVLLKEGAHLTTEASIRGEANTAGKLEGRCLLTAVDTGHIVKGGAFTKTRARKKKI